MEPLRGEKSMRMEPWQALSSEFANLSLPCILFFLAALFTGIQINTQKLLVLLPRICT
jgi:hypothetical protein